MVILQQICENWVENLKEENHRQLRMFVILCKKWKRLAFSSINQSVKSQKTVRVCEAPSTSIYRRSQQLNISKISLRRILHKELGMTPYKVQLVQELKPIELTMRFHFSKWDFQMSIFAKEISFSDEVHFDLGGYENKQNCRIWGTENQHAYIEKPTHPKRVTVWCGFWSRGIIGRFFFENEQGEAVTVNGDRYRAMLN